MVEEEVARERVQSFRDESLPPCWIPRDTTLETSSSLSPEVGNGIWLTDAEGAFRDEIVRAIREAAEVVCVASFLLEDKHVIDALLDSAARGVRVYLLTASEKLLSKNPDAVADFERERIDDHIRILNSMAGRVLVRTADTLHTKFLLTDPLGERPGGYLLTANLTSMALTRNPEIGVELAPELVRDLFRQFLIGFWREASKELLEEGQLRPVKVGMEVDVEPPEKALCTVKGVHTLRAALLNLIRKAESRIWVATFGIDIAHEVAQGLLQAAKEGKDVRLLVRTRPSEGHMQALTELAGAGAGVRGHRWIHAKAIIADTEEGVQGIVTTANLQALGLDEGFESGVLLAGSQAETLNSIFQSWWEAFPLELALGLTRGDVTGPVTLWEEGRLVETTVKESCEIDVGVVESKSPDDVDAAEPRSFPPPPKTDNPVLYKEIVYRWRVRPPKSQIRSKRERK